MSRPRRPHAHAPVDQLRPADGAELLALQRAAFAAEGRRYGPIAPLVETLAEVECALSGETVLGVRFGGQLAGAVRGRRRGEVVEIRRLMVAPELQRRGLGRRLMAAIEAAFADVRSFELATGALSEPNLLFYRALGYDVVRHSVDATGAPLVIMAREARRATGGWGTA